MYAFPQDIQKRIIQISCVQTNQTSIEKALNLVVGLNDRLDITPQQVKSISKMSCSDMSVALNIMRTIPKYRDQCTSDEMMGKDLADTNLFHRFGKIMYNKRRLPADVGKVKAPIEKVGGKDKNTKRYEGEEFDLRKNDMYFDLFEMIRRQNNFSRLSQRDFRG